MLYTRKKYQNISQVHYTASHKISSARFVNSQSKIDQIKLAFAQHGVTKLWHFTHRSNLSNILNNGILSHNSMQLLGNSYTDISDHSVQRNRSQIRVDNRHVVHDFAPLYINHKNHMLYRLERESHVQRELCLLEIDLSLLVGHEFFIANGNAGCFKTGFSNSLNDLALLNWDILSARSWNHFHRNGAYSYDEVKRLRMAEVLIHEEIPASYISAVHCYSTETYRHVFPLTNKTQLSPNLFF